MSMIITPILISKSENKLSHHYFLFLFIRQIVNHDYFSPIHYPMSILLPYENKINRTPVDSIMLAYRQTSVLLVGHNDISSFCVFSSSYVCTSTYIYIHTFRTSHQLLLVVCFCFFLYVLFSHYTLTWPFFVLSSSFVRSLMRETKGKSMKCLRSSTFSNLAVINILMGKKR